MWLSTILALLVASVFAALGVFGIVYRERAGEARGEGHLEGKTILITGGSSGIGREAAKILAKKRARLIIACRNVAKAKIVAGDIRSMTGNEEVLVMELDTSSLFSVRRFAYKFLKQESRLDVLVLNAGVFGTQKRQITSEGLELGMATNYFGHFLLANLLLGVLLKSSPSRVVVSSSALHRLCKNLNPTDLNFENAHFSQLMSYSQSKACNILFMRHFAEITKDTGVAVNAFCPGLVSTEIFDKSDGLFLRKTQRLILPFIGRTPWQGAQPIIHLSTSKETEDTSGHFFEDCKVSYNTSDLVNDPELARNIWEASERLVKLRPEEKYY